MNTGIHLLDAPPFQVNRRGTYRCANHADVTIDNFSLRGPKCSGLSVTTTTAFCTVDLVTSGGRLINVLASICLVQEIPKSEVAGCEGVASRRSVKYEKSSVDLQTSSTVRIRTIMEFPARKGQPSAN